ncbi:HesA/MoeB/ThiF family protein [Trueperella bialowiezensis]|uniref:Probable adenylyltransferase/sulfurtransferase MoeZ n=1 Tax=Trueperella bialowiezensis TaxID=312285 RepID=A0A448PE44_9ACTO|nr:ThiF family adenylyltransferase [Trueperella bialowiezensis]VEI13180.1 Probable adenylyltransferase/sulfurtransferase MoeZ [Trueperella bialowiezensis]
MTSARPLVEPGPKLTGEQRERYARHIVLEGMGELGQRRLLNARVLMIGAGGLGSSALTYLAAAGVGTIGIVDADRVDLSNLQRQIIHATSAIGELKAESAARRLRDINPDIDVIPLPVRLEKHNAAELLTGWDVVLDGTDNLATRYLISDTAVELEIPVVFGSVLQWGAQISVFWTGPRAVAAGFPAPNGLSLRDLFPVEAPPSAVPKTAEVGIMGVVPGLAGTIMASEAIKLITGTGSALIGRVCYVDVAGARVADIPLRPRP